MASLEAIREAIARIIDNETSMELYTYKHVEEFGELPAIIVEPDEADFQVAFQAGMDEWDFKVYVLTSTALDSADGQAVLDRLIAGWGPDSIRRIIYQHDDLGFSDGTNASVISMRGYGGKFTWSKIDHVGAILRIHVYTDGRA